MNNDVVEMHAIISGIVQGVGFRMTTRYYALKYEIRGEAKNLLNGDVEVYAHAPREKLDALIEHLKNDTSPAHVEKIASEYRKPTRVFEGFSVL